MKRTVIMAFFVIVLSTIMCMNNTGLCVFADNVIDLFVEEQLDGQKSSAISIAQDLCTREGLVWDDVTIRNLGDGRWRIVVVSVEQGRTGVIEVNAIKGLVISKSFK